MAGLLDLAEIFFFVRFALLENNFAKTNTSGA